MYIDYCYYCKLSVNFAPVPMIKKKKKMRNRPTLYDVWNGYVDKYVRLLLKMARQKPGTYFIVLYSNTSRLIMSNRITFKSIIFSCVQVHKYNINDIYHIYVVSKFPIRFRIQSNGYGV